MIVYISAGNSDDKLSQADWSKFTVNVDAILAGLTSEIHARWFSLGNSPWQNAAWCVEFPDHLKPQIIDALRAQKVLFGQDSIAWAQVRETEFL